jgi:hypothetical protein
VLVDGSYSPEWINSLFYFDVRGFLFFVATSYFSAKTIAHFGGKLSLSLKNDRRIGCLPGYRIQGEFAICQPRDRSSLHRIIEKLINISGTPFLLTIAGPSGAGKPRSLDRLRQTLTELAKRSPLLRWIIFIRTVNFGTAK